jgi:hypothetical protein
MNRQLTIVLLLGVVAACSGEPEPAPADGLAPVTDTAVAIDAEPLPAPVPAPPRPAERTDTVMVEGSPQVERLRLERSPDGFAVPFSTYVPEGLDVEFGAAAGIDRVRFAAAFTGTVDERAFMMVRVYPPGTTRLEVEDAVRELVASRAPGMDETSPMDAPPWADWAARLAYRRSVDQRYLGAVMVGQHGGRFFEVLRLYPAENGDGLAPRLEAILRHWRWEDTGRPLTGS